MKAKNKINKELKEKFFRLYNKGTSLRTIAQKLKVSPNTVKKYLLLQGINVKSKNIIYDVKVKDELLIGLYCGIWAGDGTQYLDNGYRIKICCHSQNKELIKFIQDLLINLFGKKSKLVEEERNRALIRFNSKFIYNYVRNFLEYKDKKTYTVHLKHHIDKYSKQFLRGFILGLMLSDGYLKERFYFNTTSKGLAKDMTLILENLGFRYNEYIHDRTKQGWKDLHSISLTKQNSRRILGIFDETLIETGYTKGFSKLKGYIEGKSGPAVI